MPSIHARPVGTALRVALAALVLPLGVSLADLFIRGPHLVPWIEVAALAVVGAALGIALRRQSGFRRWLAEWERVNAALHATETQYASILTISTDAIISVDAN